MQILFEDWQFQAVSREQVGHPHGTAAGAGDDRDAVAARQFAEGEGGGHVEHVVEILAAQDAVMAEDRIVDRAGMGQGARMRGGGAPAGLGTAHLGDDHRFARGRGLFGHGAEPRRVADLFQVSEEDVGATTVEQPVDIIMRFQADLVAGACLVGEA